MKHENFDKSKQDFKEPGMETGSRCSGFTIIEVLVALAIFSIGLLAVAQMQVNALNNTRRVKQNVDAMKIAEDQTEYLMSLPFYANRNNFDDDGDGDTDEIDETHPDLQAGTHQTQVYRSEAYIVTWTVTDDVPIGQQANVWDPTGPATITVSKTINITVAPQNDPTNTIAELEVIKVWALDNF